MRPIYQNKKTLILIIKVKKDYHQDNLSFVCLQFCRNIHLNILTSNICFHNQLKNQLSSSILL